MDVNVFNKHEFSAREHGKQTFMTRFHLLVFLLILHVTLALSELNYYKNTDNFFFFIILKRKKKHFLDSLHELSNPSLLEK